MAEVKNHFNSYVKATEEAPVIVTRNGKPVAVLLALTDEDEAERLRMAYSPRLQEILDAARQRIRDGKGIPADEFWAELEAEKAPPRPATKRRKRA
jgi:prevent-host-death family protein